MSKPIATGDGAHDRARPPRPSHRGLLVATALLLALWATFTFLARPLEPAMDRAGEAVEVGLGLDVSRGARSLEDS